MNRNPDERSAALEKVVQKFEGQVRTIGRRFGFPPAEVDELFQEIRIRLWKALKDPARIDGASATYVYRTARSAAVDLIRRKRRTQDQAALPSSLLVAEGSNPGKAPEARELAEEVSRALARLDERRRPVVRMYLAGYNHKEIAGLLGWTPGTTRNLLYRGLADLRTELSDRMDLFL